ncbi:hypothetical protein AVEN_163767-1 [Araneus ventricosus]|uniref:Uncharacterized protein n=1 Tax=Araneus ventricosus TaxID=182803 RepID=A0A4Y2HNQ0_ARAVE|nr:hypothetical protein AVEN_163767-1 [Araneus ventricosus]
MTPELEPLSKLLRRTNMRTVHPTGFNVYYASVIGGLDLEPALFSKIKHCRQGNIDQLDDKEETKRKVDEKRESRILKILLLSFYIFVAFFAM